MLTDELAQMAGHVGKIIVEQSPAQKSTVKAGNFVTFFEQINFFLENALR
jgi:hypothetical protein